MLIRALVLAGNRVVTMMFRDRSRALTIGMAFGALHAGIGSMSGQVRHLSVEVGV